MKQTAQTLTLTRMPGLRLPAEQPEAPAVASRASGPGQQHKVVTGAGQVRWKIASTCVCCS